MTSSSHFVAMKSTHLGASHRRSGHRPVAPPSLLFRDENDAKNVAWRYESHEPFGGLSDVQKGWCVLTTTKHDDFRTAVSGDWT